MFEVDTGAAMTITSALKMFGVTGETSPVTCHRTVYEVEDGHPLPT